MNCAPSNPGELWFKYREAMSDDILYRARQIDPYAQFSDEIFNNALNLINNILAKTGNHISNYNHMPKLFPPNNISQLTSLNSMIHEETNFDLTLLKKDLDDNLNKLNDDQRNIFNTIIFRSNNLSRIGKNTFFIDGPGGCGKTFLYRMILAQVRSRGKIALAVASSGIAAQLLQGARTGHSRFKIPFNLAAHSTCNIMQRSGFIILR
jgi:ABC-type ATPase with predicted acetyltransferase domain